MAVEGITNLVNNLSNQLFQQPPDTPAATAPGAPAVPTPKVAEDTFTHLPPNDSVQGTAQDAGIFQISQGALATISANVILGQPNTGAATNAGTASANDGGAGTPQAAASGAAPSAGTAAETAPANGTAIQPASGPASTAANAVNVQIQLQSLNASLPALGLTNEEIQQIDRIASLVQDFNPAAYANLINQFEALAQQAAEQSPVISAPNANAATPIDPAAAAPNGGYHVQSVSVQYAGSNGAVTSGATSAASGAAGSSNFQPGAPAAPVQQVQITLVNNRGQVVQVQSSPQFNSNPSTT
jgi:hypothetical protein